MIVVCTLAREPTNLVFDSCFRLKFVSGNINGDKLYSNVNVNSLTITVHVFKIMFPALMGIF